MSDEVVQAGPTYRVPRHRGMDPGTRRLAIIAAGLGAALFAIFGVWTASGHRSGAVPVIEADSRPVRVKPENPGGLQVAGASDEILSGDSGAQVDKLLPPPEEPEPKALKHAEQPPAPAATPAAAPAGPPAPLQSVSLSPPTAPAATPEPRPKPAAAPGPAAPAHAAAATSPGKGTQVQLAAMESEQAAIGEWQRLSKRMPEVLGGRQPAVMKVERDGRTLWRLRTGGFSDTAQATAFCDRVRAKGGACSVASF